MPFQIPLQGYSILIIVGENPNRQTTRSKVNALVDMGGQFISPQKISKESTIY